MPEIPATLMDPIVKPTEFTTAVQKLKGRHPIGAALDSTQWSKVPTALRERALFSSKVASARVMQGLKDQVLSAATPAEFVAKARPWMLANGLGRLAQKDGAVDNLDLTNHAGTERLKLIFEQNVRSARGYGWWKEGQDPDVLDAFPAQELVRLQGRKAPRDWLARWAAAGGRLFAGRMIALKKDPIWSTLSRFGTPWPPFDFNSGMGVDDVTREEAEQLGLLRPGEPVQGDEEDFNSELQASVKGLDPELVKALKDSFGDQVEETDGMLHWMGDRPEKVRTPGAPVSAALDVRTPGAHGRAIKNAIAAIDQVHDDGVLQRIPVDAAVRAKGVLGQYSFRHGGGPAGVSIKNAPDYWPGMTTAHEIGHFIDHQAMDTPGTWASETSPLFEEFRKVSAASEGFLRLQNSPRLSSSQKRYLLSFKEVWARSYAQYIAEASNDTVLKAELLRALTRGGPQWQSEDFRPIYTAIENLLKLKGWKK